MGFDRFDSVRGFDFYIRAFGCLEEAIDNRLRAICSGEHATVRFRLKINTSGFEPFDSVLSTPAVEWANERLFATWIKLAEFLWIEAVMGDITTATTRNFDLAQQVWRFLEYENFASSILGSCDGAKKSSSTAANGDEVVHRLGFSSRLALVNVSARVKLTRVCG